MGMFFNLEKTHIRHTITLQSLLPNIASIKRWRGYPLGARPNMGIAAPY